MTVPKRRRIPTSIGAEILYRADHICCICRIRGKDVQIHHIDGDRSNNTYDNLAVLCLDCHSRVSGRRGLGKAYSLAEVRKYKRSWEKQVHDSRSIHRPQVRYKKELISQIDLIICEILASRPSNPRLKELLNVLYELHLWRGSPEIEAKIREGLHHLAVMSNFSSTKIIAPLVAEKLWELCWQFVGPKDVPIRRGDLKHVLECIEALNTLAEFNCEFGHGKRPVESTTEYSEKFFELGLWYSKKPVVNAVINGYKEASRACQLGRPDFPLGRRLLRQSVRRLLKLLAEEKRDWSYQRRELQNLLRM